MFCLFFSKNTIHPPHKLIWAQPRIHAFMRTHLSEVKWTSFEVKVWLDFLLSFLISTTSTTSNWWEIRNFVVENCPPETFNYLPVTSSKSFNITRGFFNVLVPPTPGFGKWQGIPWMFLSLVPKKSTATLKRDTQWSSWKLAGGKFPHFVSHKHLIPGWNVFTNFMFPSKWNHGWAFTKWWLSEI